MTTFKLGTLVLTLVAALSLGSTAMAKGGAPGGGGASCVQITDFSMTPGVVDGQSVLTTSYSITNNCVDHERMSSAGIDYSNSTRGFAGRSAWMLPYGPTTFTSATVPITPGVTYTETLTVYTPGGKVGDTRTVTVFIPDPAAPAA